jgi:hypothetical protein
MLSEETASLVQGWQRNTDLEGVVWDGGIQVHALQHIPTEPKSDLTDLLSHCFDVPAFFLAKVCLSNAR